MEALREGHSTPHDLRRPFPDSEDGQPAKRGKISHKWKTCVAEFDSGGKRPSLSRTFAAELDAHAEKRDTWYVTTEYGGRGGRKC